MAKTNFAARSAAQTSPRTAWPSLAPQAPNLAAQAAKPRREAAQPRRASGQTSRSVAFASGREERGRFGDYSKNLPTSKPPHLPDAAGRLGTELVLNAEPRRR